MKDHAGQSISIWMATSTLPTFPTLTKNEYADVCIVGAGIAELTTTNWISNQEEAFHEYSDCSDFS